MVTSVARRAAVALVAAALVALAGVSLNRVYSGFLLVELVAGAALVAALLSALTRRLPALAAAPVQIVAMAGYALGTVSISARAGGLIGDLPSLTVDAAGNALPRLLTALIPIEPQPDTVLGPVVLAWLTAFAATELAVRAQRPGAALVPPTLLYVGALVVVGPNAPVAVWQPLAFAALAALAITVASATSGAKNVRGLRRGERTALQARTAGSAVIGLAAIMAVVAVVAPLVTPLVGSAPGDPRRYVEPPNLDVLDQNPLIRLSGWATYPEQNLFRVEILQGAAPTVAPTQTPSLDPFGPETQPPSSTAQTGGNYDTRLRLAVLPDWDGVTWHMEADYRSAGRFLPAADTPPGVDPNQLPTYPPLTVEERITVEELRGRLLPAVAAPTRVEGIRVAYDQANGALLNNTPLTAGTQYTVTSSNPSIDLTLLMAGAVPHGDAVARYLTVGPSVPPDLAQFAEKVAQGESSPYLRALAVQTFMQEHYTFAADAPSGHAYPNLSFFLLTDPADGGQVGTSEQFAAGFAVLGRLLGLPTRVVVGFHVPAGGGMVTAGDAVAWPEILFEGIGWVPFDPMPRPNTTARPVEPEFLPPPPASSAPPPSVIPSLVSATNGYLDDDSQAAAPGSGADGSLIARGAGLGVVALVAAALLIIMLIRGIRSRRHLASADPASRVVGAWDEVLDGLLLAGAPPPPSATTVEVAEHAAAVIARTPGRHARTRMRPPAPDLAGLARTVNEVAFGGATMPVADAELANKAKVRAVAYRRALYRRRPWLRRLLWWVDPRPLRRRKPPA